MGLVGYPQSVDGYFSIETAVVSFSPDKPAERRNLGDFDRDASVGIKNNVAMLIHFSLLH